MCLGLIKQKDNLKLIHKVGRKIEYYLGLLLTPQFKSA
jgi:hypothetical protein